jgi:hypothetical protein
MRHCRTNRFINAQMNSQNWRQHENRIPKQQNNKNMKLWADDFPTLKDAVAPGTTV